MKQIKEPRIAIMLQTIRVMLQLNFSVRTAIPYVEIALPMYVQALRSPDTVETFPVFSKNGGIIQISIKFTPCILPARSAVNKTERAVFLPVDM